MQTDSSSEEISVPKNTAKDTAQNTLQRNPAEEVYNINIASERTLPTPKQIKELLPISDKAKETVLTSRAKIKRILERADSKLIIVAGPCSIHDEKIAKVYAEKLSELSSKVEDKIMLLMRVYFEKPRTSVGWKGLINDPHLNDTFKIDEGLKLARRILLDIAELGLAVGTEALDPITPQYIQDLISWTTIGARTTESQTHREMASGLSTPVGFKNGTDGGISVAINAIKAAQSAHHFLGISQDGISSIFETTGNNYGHLVLRGGNEPNYDSVSISIVEEKLKKAFAAKNTSSNSKTDLVSQCIFVDCSHGNSRKDYRLQGKVFKDCLNQIAAGNKSIVGLMLESNLFEGSQDLTKDLSALKFGVSITDSCIGWEETEALVLEAYQVLKQLG